MSTIFVTGGAGFIGSHLCGCLLKGGYTVICLDNFDSFYDPNLKFKNFEEMLKKFPGQFELITGDIRNPEHLQEAFNRSLVRCVVHLCVQLAKICHFQNVTVLKTHQNPRFVLFIITRKCCIETGEHKNSISGRKQRANRGWFSTP